MISVWCGGSRQCRSLGTAKNRIARKEGIKLLLDSFRVPSVELDFSLQ